MIVLLTILWLLVSGCDCGPGPEPVDGGHDTGDAGFIPVPPMASAGPDLSVVRGQWSMLNGGGSMSRCGSDISFEWHQVSGPTTTLSNYNSPVPAFIAPLDPVELVYELRVSDACGTDTDSVTIRVGPQIWPTLVPPVPSAGGDLAVPVRWSGQLKGSGSLWFTGGSRDYLWRTVPAGMITVGDTSETPQVSVPADLDLGLVRLEVRANINWSAPDQAVVIPQPSALQPSSVPQPTVTDPTVYVIPSQQTVYLAGVPPSTDYDEFLWRQVLGSPVEIRRPTSIETSFPAPAVADTLVFALKGRKGALWSAPAFKTVYVWGGGYDTPHAVAGEDLGAGKGTSVQLDGSMSTVDARRIKDIKFKWVQTAGEIVTLDTATTMKPVFTAPEKSGRLCFMLTVSDGMVASQPDSVVVTVE